MKPLEPGQTAEDAYKSEFKTPEAFFVDAKTPVPGLFNNETFFERVCRAWLVLWGRA